MFRQRENKGCRDNKKLKDQERKNYYNISLRGDKNTYDKQ